MKFAMPFGQIIFKRKPFSDTDYKDYTDYKTYFQFLVKLKMFPPLRADRGQVTVKWQFRFNVIDLRLPACPAKLIA